jgi:hypothetical protein
MLERAQKAWTASKLNWLAIVVVQFASAGFAAWVAWARPEHGVVAIALPVAGLLLPVLTYFLRSRAGDAYARGEAWRRVFLLNDSLGYEPSAGEYVALLLDADEGGFNLQRKPAGKYYASEQEPGYPRLLENLAESAFYTTHLATVMAGICSAAVVSAALAFALVVLGVLASPDVSPEGGTWLGEMGPRVAAMTSPLLAFFAAGQLMELAGAYSKLTRASRAVLDRAIDPRNSDLSQGAVLSLLGSYESALAAAALPIPDLLTRMRSKKLNEDWRAVRERRKRAIAAQETRESSKTP